MIRLASVEKVYSSGEKKFKVSNDISLTVEAGEFAIFVGESGAGKSTILNIISGLEKPDSGSVTINGVDVSRYNENQLADYRKDQVGFVFQFYNLIPNLTVKENVELTARMKGNSHDAKEILEMVGLGHRLNSFPSQLSGGEQQRVSIARAIVKKPDILLCDEPTGALDHQTSKDILSLLQQLSTKNQMTILMVTHNRGLIPMANRVFEVSDGKIQREIKNDRPRYVSSLEW
ncbi:ABC transporter ATP-binding protein [Enterococcus larvae]|uniref:ABC transporter ATP-binding protein n=1 Tax=Enterococcus larvae TaxID=2794352 RepID=UPI003F3F4692